MISLYATLSKAKMGALTRNVQLNSITTNQYNNTYSMNTTTTSKKLVAESSVLLKQSGNCAYFPAFSASETAQHWLISQTEGCLRAFENADQASCQLT